MLITHNPLIFFSSSPYKKEKMFDEYGTEDFLKYQARYSFLLKLEDILEEN